MSREFKCPKCEHSEVSVRWIDSKNEGMRSKPERLRVGCQNCGYIWDERPSDEQKK